MPVVYSGFRTYIHTGTTPGYVGFVALVPAHKLGMFLALTGDDYGFEYRLALASYILDTMTGDTPWLNTSTLCTFPQPWAQDKTRPPYTFDPNLPPSRPLSQYTGVYRSDIYGDLIVDFNITMNALQIRF
ncbi:uncharacterized protein LOC106013603 [Aplysia californica]|uniref:Uncharacterized protein LOC106013603 n=1 Tax=Aplysia californica TaxID=6500 RepID=A0ABM1ACT4_APLCA|nr:uncharacterized protein LOC106013603 [Aplysia californica]